MKFELDSGDHDLVWYFAYGSNLSSKKFIGSRGIVPISTARVQVPGWRLSLNIPGLPYSEPTFMSVEPRPVIEHNSTTTDNSSGISHSDFPDVLGLAYLITEEQYRRVIGSEGGGIAYRDVLVDAVPVDESDREKTGTGIGVRTLVAAIERHPEPLPSKRYMDIVISGALEAGMPRYYQLFLESIPVYQPPADRRGKIGAGAFLAFWGPVMGLMEKITNATLRGDGSAPKLVIILVRLVMFLIWFCHDTFFAPLCGRGDGCTQSVGSSQAFENIGEKEPLLRKSADPLHYLV